MKTTQKRLYGRARVRAVNLLSAEAAMTQCEQWRAAGALVDWTMADLYGWPTWREACRLGARWYVSHHVLSRHRAGKRPAGK